MELMTYKTLPIWTKNTFPQLFQEKHNTKVGTWSKLTVLQGRIKVVLLTETGDITHEAIYSSHQQPPLIKPQAWHRVAMIDEETQCQLAFLCEKKDYFHKKYALTPTHSAVMATLEHLPLGKVLDLGCGRGRNSLFLALNGYEVTAVDRNEASIAFLQRIATQESLALQTQIYDINQATIQEKYDIILSTVVFMFLSPEAIPNIIRNMQAQTRLGGVNLIVAGMSTKEMPCPVDFPFTFKEKELKNYYKGWELITYQEALGHLHKTDAKGNRIAMQFVTMLARKVEE